LPSVFIILFGGDTAYTDVFRKIRSSKPVDLAIMLIGAYDPWIHCNPEQAVAMANQAGAEFVLPVHHRTFKLSNEPYEEPIEKLLQAVGSAEYGIPIREIGEEFHLSAVGPGSMLQSHSLRTVITGRFEHL
jgi:L-ascorbate metabolism protein UlaG (beta-lactamase superfamily)